MSGIRASSRWAHVRLSALALIQTTGDSFLLAGLVQSGWSAALLDKGAHKVEVFHGSLALVLAAEQGLITLEACLDQIALSAYENFAERLGPEAVTAIADRLDTAIHKAAKFQITTNLPNIEQSFEGRFRFGLFQVSDKPSHDESPIDQLRRSDETGDAWYERQMQNQEAADQFERDLTKAGAQLIIQSVTIGLIAAIDKEIPSLIDSWGDFFLELEKSALNNVHNIASITAEAISKRDIKRSISLFERLRNGAPHVRVTFGLNRVGLDAATVWGALDSVELKKLRFARLDQIGNDHELAMEVLAATRAERLHILRDYVIDRRSRPEPAHRARAAMVAGLSPNEAWAIETIDTLREEHGFLRRVYEGAKYAMDRYQWSRHWATQMRTATDPMDLWRYSVLLSKIVDGRFDGSEVEGESPSSLINRFGTTFNDPISDRIRKWKGKRDSKLFGMNAPKSIFLSGDKSAD